MEPKNKQINKQKTSNSYRFDGYQKWGWVVGELEVGGQKVWDSSYKTNKCKDIMYTMITIVNTAVWYIGKLLRK